MVTGTARPAFHADEVEETNEYRSLSVLAIMSFIAGLASPLAFGHPLLMVVPLAGVVISLLALRQIAANEGVMAGRWAALAGLVLCVVFAVAPFTREYVLRTVRTKQATEFARSWINLVLNGNTESAFRLTTDSTRPARQPEPGGATPKATPYETFTALPIVKALVAAGADADIRFVDTPDYKTYSSKSVIVDERFDITPKAGDAKPLNLIVRVQHGQFAGESRLRWMMGSVDDASHPLPSASN
jgi:hypothetical protein